MHLAHAFVHSDFETRADKVRNTLDEIGVSVLGGMLTSASAAMALLLCVLQFFAKFGTFLLLTVLFSWLWANLCFLAMMALFGPDESTPQWLQNPLSLITVQLPCKARNSAPKPKNQQAQVAEVMWAVPVVARDPVTDDIV